MAEFFAVDPTRLLIVAKELFPEGDWLEHVAKMFEVKRETVERWSKPSKRKGSRFSLGAPKSVEIALECMLSVKQGEKA